MKKLFIISLDVLVALPILSMAMSLLFSSIEGSQAYLPSLGSSEGLRLNAIVASQQMALAIDASASNYSAAVATADALSTKYGVSASLLGQDNAGKCGVAHAFCRLITVSGNAYLLAVSYENTS